MPKLSYSSLWGTVDDVIKIIISYLSLLSADLFALTCKRFNKLVHDTHTGRFNNITHHCNFLPDHMSRFIPLNPSDNIINDNVFMPFHANEIVAFMFEKWFTMKMGKTGTSVRKYLNSCTTNHRIVMYPCVHSSKKYEEHFKNINKKRIRTYNGEIQLIQFSLVKYKDKVFRSSSEYRTYTNYMPMPEKKIITGFILPLQDSIMTYLPVYIDSPRYMSSFDTIYRYLYVDFQHISAGMFF